MYVDHFCCSFAYEGRQVTANYSRLHHDGCSTEEVDNAGNPGQVVEASFRRWSSRSHGYGDQCGHPYVDAYDYQLPAPAWWGDVAGFQVGLGDVLVCPGVLLQGCCGECHCLVDIDTDNSGRIAFLFAKQQSSWFK